MTSDHIAAGDRMQSEFSRLLEWVAPMLSSDSAVIPYEVRMAVHEGRSAIAAWTDARRADARD